MAVLTAYKGAMVGAPGEIHTAAKNAVLSRAFDLDGNEYIYLKGVASTILGSVVTFDEAGATLLIAANAVGPVAVATAITVASTWGWYGFCGTFSTDVVANCADNAKLGRETTDGKVGDGPASGDVITGAVSRAATTAAAIVACQFIYASVNDSSA